MDIITIKDVNKLIKKMGSYKISDGYHTFGELYEHRAMLFIALCSMVHLYSKRLKVWKSQKHFDGTMYKGYFILGIGTKKGEQITYHLPMEYWNNAVVDYRSRAPKFDGHTSKDVLERLKKI